MATHSSTLAWKIPWTEEPGGLRSMGLHRVGHGWSDLAAAAGLQGKTTNECAGLHCHSRCLPPTKGLKVWVIRWTAGQVHTVAWNVILLHFTSLSHQQVGMGEKWDAAVQQWLSQCRRCKRCRFNPWGQEDPLEEEMATHSSILAWEIPWTEEPGGLQSMGSHRVGHNWVTEHIWARCRREKCFKDQNSSHSDCLDFLFELSKELTWCTIAVKRQVYLCCRCQTWITITKLINRKLN